MNMNADDFKILDEALDAWIDKDAAGEMMGTLLMGMLTKDSPEAKAQFKADQEREKRTREEKHSIRKRQATILKAKLYEMAAQDGANVIISRASA